jgi:hypothetical protein
LIQLQHVPELLHLALRQRTETPGRKIQLQKTNLHAPQLFHQLAEVLEHHADLILPAF